MKRVISGLQFVLRHADYAIFVALIMWKLYWFAKSSGFVFVTKNMVLISLGSVVLVSFWVLLLTQAYRLLALAGLNLIITFVILSDLIYFRYFGDVISVPVLMQASQATALGGSIANLFRWRDLLIIGDLLVFIPMAIWLFRRGRQSRGGITTPFWIRLGLGTVAFGIGYILVANPINAYVEKWGKNLFINNWSNTSVYNVTGLLGFHAQDAYKYFKDNVLNKKVISSEQKAITKQWFEEQGKQKGPLYGAAKGKNVIVFQAEAFQNFVIGKKVNGVEITPNLNKLVNESLYFKNFYHQVGQGRTSDAEFMSNCSLYPLPSGSVYIRYPGNEYDCVPEQFKANGYSTAAFHAYEPNFWNRYSMYGNIGFDRFYSQNDFVMDEKVGWALGDESLFRQSLDKMKQMDKPFYSFIVGLSSHHPFTIPKEYHKLELGEYEGTDFGNYLQSVNYVDYSIGKMVEMMKEQGLWDETVFVVYGDHDSGTMRDDGAMAKFIGEEQDQLSYIQMQNQVPLLIRLPDGQGARTYNEVAGQMDIAPTLLHLAGIPSKEFL